MTPLMIGKKSIRPPGQRIIKTTIAVFLCMMYGYVRKSDTAIFFAAVGAVFSLRTDLKTTWASALDRFVGTAVGGTLGLVAVLLQIYFKLGQNSFRFYLILTFVTFVNLWLVANLFRPGGTLVSCIVLFAVALFHVTGDTAFQYAVFRLLDTGFGLLAALLINLVWPPKKSNAENEPLASSSDS